MNHASLAAIWRKIACALALGTTLAVGSGCGLRWGVAAPVVVYDEDEPPIAYIDTAEPIYYEGHASYWYGNRWYYRDGPRWRHYDREPDELRERRSHGPPKRRVYEQAVPHRIGPPRGRPVRREERHENGHGKH